MKLADSDPIGPVLAAMQGRAIAGTFYMGIPTIKNPADAWAYREIIFAQRPPAIVELGIRTGGHLLSLAHFLDAMQSDAVLVGVDISLRLVAPAVFEHPRIRMVEAPALDSVEYVRGLAGPTALVIEDSSHEYEHTLAVLRAYAGFVPPGGYLIVEDTICHHPLNVGPSPGPFEAVHEFLRESAGSAFSPDHSVEPPVTWNPDGYLRRRP